ncbi:MAG: four helix bundle protein [Saprospiraceae bacterium]|nr:four helix bundle protein [Saprospiraceae bacterium]
MRTSQEAKRKKAKGRQKAKGKRKAEGFGRYGNLDKSRFYKFSCGSFYELISQSMASFALGFIKNKEEETILIQGYREIINELDSLIKTVETKHRD